MLLSGRMSKPNLSPLQLALQKAALPGVWSRGVSFYTSTMKAGRFAFIEPSPYESHEPIVGRPGC